LLVHHGSGNVLRDYSPYGNNGRLYGGFEWRDGPWGWGVWFDGSTGYAEVPDDPSLRPSVFTLEAWVRVVPRGVFQHIVSKFDGVAPRKGYMLQMTSGNRLTFSLTYDDTFYHIEGPVEAEARWRHLIGVFDGVTQEFYIDNSLVGSQAAAVTHTTYPLNVGRMPNPAANYTEGIVVFPRLYSRVLTAEERTRHFELLREVFGV